MRIEIKVDNWQVAWDWCNDNLVGDKWDMITDKDNVMIFSVDNIYYEEFMNR